MYSYDMYHDIDERLAEVPGSPVYTGKHLRGLPLGLELPNGVVVGAAA